MTRAFDEESLDRVGAVLGERYRLVRGVGVGGMGAVFEAEHLITRRRVAVKLMHPSSRWSASSVERFLREARIVAALGHPAIIDVLDAGRDEHGAPFLVFELLRGRSLAEAIEVDGPMPTREALAIVAEVLDALSVAHARGVLHRDIKPDNIFLALDGRGERVVKLLDFGISKVAQGVLGDDATSHTSGGTLVGTPLYMSPEQARATQDLDGRSDLWSLGVTLYELLTGDTPWPGRAIPAVVYDICHAPHPSAAALRPDLSPAVLAVLDRALQKDRAQRYDSADAMRADVVAALDGVAEVAVPAAITDDARAARTARELAATLSAGVPPRPTRRGARPGVIAGAVTLGAVLGAIAFASLSRSAPSASPQLVSRPTATRPVERAPSLEPVEPSPTATVFDAGGAAPLPHRVVHVARARPARPSVPAVIPAPTAPAPRRTGLAPVTDIDSM